jgi:hypothetical protein
VERNVAASAIANGAKKSMAFTSAPFGFVMSVTSHSACQLATMAVEIALLYMSGIVGQQNNLIRDADAATRLLTFQCHVHCAS